jgi:hypothetical protein
LSGLSPYINFDVALTSKFPKALSEMADNAIAQAYKGFMHWLRIVTKDFRLSCYRARFVLEVAGLLVLAFYTYEARYANQLTREARRPYIWFTNNDGLGRPQFVLNTNKSGLGQVIWDWHFTNYGQSPAYNVIFLQFIKLGNGPFRLSYGETKPDVGAPLPPNKDDFATVVSAPIEPQEFNQLMTATGRDNGIAIKLAISYTDESGIKHETKVRLDRLATGAIAYSEAEMK